jgi:spore coat protein U-like protein
MKFNMKKLSVALAAVFLVSSVIAATETGTLTVNATVAGSCAVGNATLAFAVAPTVNADGSGSQSSTNVTATTKVNVICTSGQSGSLSATDGANYDATAGRRLSDGAATPTYIPYQLYTDAGFATVFDTTNVIPVTGSGSSQEVDIYGKIAAADATAAPRGSYADLVTLTISYTP